MHPKADEIIHPMLFLQKNGTHKWSFSKPGFPWQNCRREVKHEPGLLTSLFLRSYVVLNGVGLGLLGTHRPGLERSEPERGAFTLAVTGKNPAKSLRRCYGVL